MKRAGRIIRIVGMWGVLAATAGALRSDAAPPPCRSRRQGSFRQEGTRPTDV